jgi:hypothetical protein
MEPVDGNAEGGGAGIHRSRKPRRIAASVVEPQLPRPDKMARGPACYAEPLILNKKRFLRKHFCSKTSAGL